ncbi:MAG TPA: rhamnogalacturonan acetylesterase [Verrucomicrobiae bacterium]|nr:rhamnogalacturonan acetylesterase [Verrucomicrobiae bacterium]
MIKFVFTLLGFLTVVSVEAQTNAAASPSSRSASEPAKAAKDGKVQQPQLDLAARPITNGFTIFLIGDSTMANKPLIPENPERGWGQMLPPYFKAGVRVENHAMNGRSSKSFRDEGRWQTVENSFTPGDWVIIQFGHNDEKDKDALRYAAPFGTFKTNLTQYVLETRAHGANPILATPVARRKFDDGGKVVDTHGDYVTVVRQVAAEQGVPLMDLNKRSDELLRREGPELSKKIYIWVTAEEYPGLPKGRQDDTHFCAYGASRMCDLAVLEIKTAVPELARYLNTSK